MLIKFTFQILIKVLDALKGVAVADRCNNL